MKVGDLVQYVAHAAWNNGGLGILTDVMTRLDKSGKEMKLYQVTWLDDIEDFGFTEAVESVSEWYDDLDMKEDIKLFAEAG